MQPRDPLFSGEVRALSAAIALACLILAAVILSEIGAFLVKRIAIFAAVAATAIALSGCATGQNQADLLKQLDTNFANCERHITFQAGVGVITPGASVSGSVDCKGNVPAVAVVPAP